MNNKECYKKILFDMEQRYSLDFKKEIQRIREIEVKNVRAEENTIFLNKLEDYKT
jgi:hypothetical protein